MASGGAHLRATSARRSWRHLLVEVSMTISRVFLTADTWVALAIWLRNTFLNQMILVSGFFSVLLGLLFVGKDIMLVSWDFSVFAPILLFLFATATIGIELQKEYSRIRFMDEHKTDLQEPEPPRRFGGEKTIQALIVLPLLVASVLHLRVVCAVSRQPFSIFHPSPEYIGMFVLLWLLVAGAAVTGGSFEAYKGLNRISDLSPDAPWLLQVRRAVGVGLEGIGGLIIFNAAVSALAGSIFFGAVCWVLRWHRPSWVPSEALGGPATWQIHSTFGPPLVFSVPFFTIVIGAGLVGRVSLIGCANG